MKKYMLFPLIGLLVGCSSARDSVKSYEQYERLMIHTDGRNLIAGYDTDKDGMEDLRCYYEIAAIREDKTCCKLVRVMEDKNKNGVFEDDEIIWQKEQNDTDKKNLGTPLLNLPQISS